MDQTKPNHTNQPDQKQQKAATQKCQNKQEKQDPSKCLYSSSQQQVKQSKKDQQDSWQQQKSQSQSGQNSQQCQPQSSSQSPSSSSCQSSVSNQTPSQKRNDYKANIVLNPHSINQVLNLVLQPGKTVWYQGQIIASNQPYSNVENIDNFDFDRILHYMKMKTRIPKKLNNTSAQIAYFSIRKRGGGGKILTLTPKIYKTNFWIDPLKVLTINKDPFTYTLSQITNIPNLSQIKFKSSQSKPEADSDADSDAEEDNDLEISLQSNLGNLIFQKSLGKDQKLFLGNSEVIAMSQGISVQDDGKMLVGPGFVFLEVSSNSKGTENHIAIYRTTIILLLLLKILIVISYSLQ